MASFMRVPSFDDDGDAVVGVGGGREAAASSRARETGDDARVERAGKKKSRARETASSRGDARAREATREGASGSERARKKNRQREPAAATGGGDDGTGAASREVTSGKTNKTSGKNLGRRRRAAEKRRRLAEERRAARGDGTRDAEAREARKPPAPPRMVDDDVASESSDYDEELLPEPRLETNEPVSESEEDESEARRRRAAAATSAGAAAKSSSSFMNKMRAKLSGGQFRMLNEKLYTTTGDEGLDLVKNAPELFEAYHAGFRAQVESWPTKPVDVVAALLKKSPKSWIVADFGCGDAELGRVIEQKCHSFDLQTPESAPEVIACNMSDVPLDDASVDCAVFSLSLMGTDYGSFLEEAHRVLKPGGLLWIAEVRSRFDGKNGTASVASFVAALAELGFKRKRDVDERNTMFFTAEFIKTWVSKGKHAHASSSTRRVRWPPLKACTYKRR